MEIKNQKSLGSSSAALRFLRIPIISRSFIFTVDLLLTQGSPAFFIEKKIFSIDQYQDTRGSGYIRLMIRIYLYECTNYRRGSIKMGRSVELQYFLVQDRRGEFCFKIAVFSHI